MRHLLLTTSLLLLGCLGAACSGKPAPASPEPAAAQPAAAALPEPTPAPEAAPAAPAGRANPAAAAARVNSAPAPASAPTRREQGGWGKVESETVEGTLITRRVTSPWGTITVTGPTEEPGNTAVRYWTAWLAADFDAVNAFATGRMRQGLSSMDNDEGRARYAESIPKRYADNPVASFSVDGITEATSGTATVSTTLTRKDGTTEGRRMQLERAQDSWKINYIGR
ncbi:MAG: hypothetical protein H6744_05470 [Deltaproteobacteria bacterium]|nr:hypothetical protein [Deltaproteobacteria bacterium]MCB9786128.1 hypothetical protein [Deltaproteobacteria bacterium]